MNFSAKISIKVPQLKHRGEKSNYQQSLNTKNSNVPNTCSFLLETIVSSKTRLLEKESSKRGVAKFHVQIIW